MAISRTSISNKFKNTDIPSENDFQEIFDNFVHKDEDKADFEMVQAGTDTEHYITPDLLRSGLQNIGIITGNCYMPNKEYFKSTLSQTTTLLLEQFPIENSVKIYKNGQLLQEGEEEDYTVDYDTAIITFSAPVTDRNIEVDYWFTNLGPVPGGSESAPITGEPTQITINTAVSITTDTRDANSKKQIGKNVVINNGTNAINITVNGGTNFSASYLKHGTGSITFVQGTGRTLVQVDGSALFNGVPGSTATISSIGTTDYLRISNA